jgi:hypothetical protein
MLSSVYGEPSVRDRVIDPVPHKMLRSGLNAFRSGGSCFRSLTIRLNVPVVRERIRALV